MDDPILEYIAPFILVCNVAHRSNTDCSSCAEYFISFTQFIHRNSTLLNLVTMIPCDFNNASSSNS